MLQAEIGHVYFIQAANGLIKIGHTRRPLALRLRVLRAGSPIALEPMGVIEAGRDLERLFHRRFAAVRAHGEWFGPERSLLRFIEHHVKPWPTDREGPDPSEPMTPARRLFWELKRAGVKNPHGEMLRRLRVAFIKRRKM